MNKELLNNFINSIDVNHCLLTDHGRLYIFFKSNNDDYYRQVTYYVSSNIRFKQLVLTIPDDDLYIASHGGIKNLLKEKIFKYFNID